MTNCKSVKISEKQKTMLRDLFKTEKDIIGVLDFLNNTKDEIKTLQRMRVDVTNKINTICDFLDVPRYQIEKIVMDYKDVLAWDY